MGFDWNQLLEELWEVQKLKKDTEVLLVA